MFGSCRKGLNVTNIQYKSAIDLYKNSHQSCITKSFIKTNITKLPVRNFVLFENQHSTSRWLKLFGDLNSQGRASGIRCFRQKVPQSSNPKSGPFVRQKEIPQLGKTEELSVSWGTLKRPLIFTIGFTAFSFSSAAIWQYENMRKIATEKGENGMSRAKDLYRTWSMTVPKAGRIREEINAFWNRLNEGEKLFVPILAINVLVFALWRVPALQPVMFKYFSANPQMGNKGLPMLLSAFSHCSLLHLACNMYVLHSFSGPIVAALGKEQFMGLYMSSCVVSSFFSHLAKIATGRMGSSLGASGAICTVLGVFGTLVPDARMQIVFLPFFTFSASMGIKGLMALDTAGIIAGWQMFDHAAHLSGVLFGIWWCYQGHSIIWHNREYVMNWWHENVRERSPR